MLTCLDRISDTLEWESRLIEAILSAASLTSLRRFSHLIESLMVRLESRRSPEQQLLEPPILLRDVHIMLEDRDGVRNELLGILGPNHQRR